MGALSDYLAANSVVPTGPAHQDPSVFGELSKGISRGLRSTGSNFEEAGALGAEALGLDGVATGLRSSAKGLRDAAAAPAFAAEAPTWDSVHGVGQGLRWGVGKAGEMLPVMAGAVAGGLATGNPLVGGTLAMYPDQVGQIAQRQNEDPSVAAQPVGDRALRAFGYGAPAAVVANLPLGGLAGKLGAKALPGMELAASKTIGGALVRNVGEGAATGALGMGSAEKLNQLGVNPDAATNWDQIGEAAGSGAVAMGIGHIPAAGLSYAKGNGAAIGDAVGGVRTSINDRLAAGKAKVDEAAAAAADTTVGKKVSGIYEDLGDLMQKGKDSVSGVVGKVMRGEEIGIDPAELATASKERLKEMFDFSDNAKVKAASEWVDKMANDAGLTPERRQEAADLVGKVSDRAGQVAAATLKKAVDLGKAAGEKIDKFTSAVKQGYAEGKYGEGGKKADIDGETRWVDEPLGADRQLTDGAKKSEDYSGAQAVILKSLQDSGLAKSRPDLFESADKVNELAGGLRAVLDQMATGPVKPETIKRLTNVLGMDTGRVMNSLKKALKSDMGDGEAEAYFVNLNKINEVAKATDERNANLKAMLAPEHQDMSGYDLMRLGDHLTDHASGRMANPSEKPSAKGTAMDNLAREAYSHYFGENADAATKLIEKEAKGKGERPVDASASHLDEDGNMVETDNAGFDEQGDRLDPAPTKTMRFGLSKADTNGNSKSALDGHPMLEDSKYGKQHLLDLKAKYPEQDVRFEKMDGSEYGHIVVEERADPNKFNDADLAAMTHDTKKFAGSPSRIKVGDQNFDAVKIAKVMRERGQADFEGPTKTTTKENLADAFKQGIAQLTEQLGKRIDVKDDAVIGFVGGKQFTWGEAKKLVTNTAENRMSKSGQAKLEALRKEYKEASPADRKDILKEVQALADFEKNRELTNDPISGETSASRHANKMDPTRLNTVKGDRRGKYEHQQPEPHNDTNSRFDAEGNLTKEGAQMLLMGDAHGGIEVNAPSKSLHELDRRGSDIGAGRSEVGSDENVHLTTAAHGDEMTRIANMDGSGQWTSPHLSGEERTARSEMKAGIANWRDMKSAPALKIADRAQTLLSNAHMMTEGDRTKLYDLAGGSPAEASKTVNALATKYKDRIVGPGEKGAPPMVAEGGAQPANPVRFDKNGKVVSAEDSPGLKVEAPKAGLLEAAIAKRQEYLNNPPGDYSTEVAKGHLDWATRQKERVDAEYNKVEGALGEGHRVDALGDLQDSLGRLITKAKSVLEGDASLESEFGPQGGTPNPKELAAKKAALLEAASSSDPKLLKELATTDNAKGLQRAAEVLPVGEASRVANERLGKLVEDPNTAYDLMRKSAESTDPLRDNSKTSGQDIKDHIEKVLGKSVKLAWAQFSHAGEFTKVGADAIIRLSVHALDPMSTAHHESLHAFFSKLRDAGAHDVTSVLEKAASSAHVLEQLREKYKGQPEVLKQLADPEERAAYMYQAWAADPTGFKVSIAAKTTFQKIAQFVRETLGIWSNDERALHIMKYFHEGEYAKNMNSPSAVRAELMGRNRSHILDTAKTFVEPLAKMADSVIGMGGDRLRDTQIPSLGKLADIMKREHTTEGGDQGFISASRIEGTKRMAALGEVLHSFNAEHMRDAMEALQQNKPAATPEAQAAADAIKKFLGETRDYMVKAGVNIGNLGKDYFPRVWDTHYISKNQQAFRDMLEPYIRSGQMKGSADKLINNLTSRGGSELGIESRESNQPGMQFGKERLLDFITPEDAAQFMNKDLLGTLSSYVGQASRKAEWTRRLGGGKLESLLADAKAEGATREHMALAEKYMKGVDGTLGDDMSPTLRRLTGNLIVYQNIRLLPTAAFSMLIDPNGVMVRGGTVGDAWNTFKRGMAGIPKTFSKEGGEVHDLGTKWAELVGVVDSAMMSHVMGDIYTQGMVGGSAQKMNNAFFKYNLVEGLNRNFRIGATEASIKFLAHHMGGLDGTGVSKHSRRWMRELGLQQGDIIKTKDGIALTEAEGLSPEQVTRVHAAVNQWVDGAVLRPDAADKPIWMNDPHYALFSHLKQFVFSFQKTILERTVHEFQHGNYTPAMALASYVPIMLAADYAKGMLVTGGGTPAWQEGWDMADYLGYATQRAGLFGVGQFGLDVAKDLHRGGMGLGALAGPTIEQFGDVVSTLGGHKQFGNTVIDAMPANTFVKGWFNKGESKADPMMPD